MLRMKRKKKSGLTGNRVPLILKANRQNSFYGSSQEMSGRWMEGMADDRKV